jgi:hypothetical protein
MKRLFLILLIALFASTSLTAGTMGLYFDLWPGTMAYAPPPTSFFDVYLYLHASNYYVTAVEYQITTPLDPTHMFFALAVESYSDQVVVTLGSPWEGHSIAFWPPLNGYDPGYNMICKFKCMMLAPCLIPGFNPPLGDIYLADYPIVVGPHPGSGELWGTYFPNNDTFPIIGLRSTLCPDKIAVENTNWGAIKSLYR